MTYLLFLAATGFMTANNGADETLPVKALSFNVRYGTANDGENSWPRRRELVFQVIRQQDADFVGVQEALRFQLDAIHRAVPGYAELGRGRKDGKESGEYSAILYRKQRWKLDRGETLWLSDTPRTPGSASWGNTIPRIVTWGRFVDRESGRAVYVFNTHLDHRSQPSREKSAAFLRDLIRRHAADAPVILMGDLNASEDNEAIRLLKETPVAGGKLVDSFRVAHPDARQVGTFNGFEGRGDGAKIDYVFTNPEARVESAQIIRTHQDSRYPSDHFPVSASLVFPAGENENENESGSARE